MIFLISDWHKLQFSSHRKLHICFVIPDFIRM